MNPEVVIADAAVLSRALAFDFEAEGRRAIGARGRFIVAVPGGSVGSQCFPELGRLSFDWSRTEFIWVDERGVAPSDPESNYALARSLWLEPAGVPAARIHRMPADDADLHQAAMAYADRLRAIAGDPPRLDFVLLGAGSDGHVASLFPGDPVAGNTQDLVAVVDDAPMPPRRRLTLTLPVLADAGRVVVAAFGTSKAEAIRDALERPESVLPLAAVMRRSRRPLILVDHGAAALLTAGRY